MLNGRPRNLLLLGVRQDAQGRLYRACRYEESRGGNFGDQGIVPYIPTISAPNSIMESILVDRLSYRAAKGITPETPEQARKLQAIIDSGPTYWSIRLFHDNTGI